MKIRFKIILHRNKLMFNIIFGLIGMDERENCPSHFWLYKSFVNYFHRNRTTHIGGHLLGFSGPAFIAFIL